MEVLAVRGKASTVKQIADELIAAKGVKHGKLTLTTTGSDLPAQVADPERARARPPVQPTCPDRYLSGDEVSLGGRQLHLNSARRNSLSALKLTGLSTFDSLPTRTYVESHANDGIRHQGLELSQ